LATKGDCLAASFLTSKGRIFANTFLYLENNDDILVDVHTALAADLKRHLTLYKLRSKVTISSPNYGVWFQPHSATDTASQQNIILKTSDPRITDFGYRIIKSAEEDKSDTKNNVSEWMSTFNLLNGLAEGPEISNRIPLECNLDLLRYISFSKGCYVGQELTARTRYKGLVRKRLVPFLRSPSLEKHVTNNISAFELLPEEIMKKILSGTEEGNLYGSEFSLPGIKQGSKLYKNVDEASIGEIIHTNSNGSIGLAMVNLDALLHHTGNFTVVESVTENEKDETLSQSNNERTPNVPQYIATFRPTWFHGLDEKTNLKLNE